MNKRGVGVLIATVLLIGLAIILSAITLLWGIGFFSTTTSETGGEAERLIEVISDGDIKVKSARIDPSNNRLLILVVENNGDLDIINLFIRIIQDEIFTLDYESSFGSLLIKPYEIRTLTIDTGIILDINSIVEVFPVFLVEDEEVEAPYKKYELALMAESGALTYSGPFIDLSSTTSEQWTDIVNQFNQLRDIGFTHVGIHLWNMYPDAGALGLTASRMADLRAEGFDIALHHSGGHMVLTDKDQLDSQNHPSNGQNLKYFDSLGFDPYVCAIDDCSVTPERRAHDPAYDGEIWQTELSLIDDLMNRVDITFNDLVIFDTEVWGARVPLSIHYNYPDVIWNSVLRYTGTNEERVDQYYNYWRQRGQDLVGIVKAKDSDIFTLFYNENIAELERDATQMPSGVGDAASPSFYFAPNLSRLQEELDKGDFSGSYPWISFWMTNEGWTDRPRQDPDSTWVFVPWDPEISQKFGFMLREAGAKGIVEHPGPRGNGVPEDHYLAHSRAFMRGFVDGIDPGTLVEICGDGWDNDGDGLWDESDCVP